MTRSDLPEPLRERVAVTVPEVARLAGLSTSVIRTEIALGRLRARQVGAGTDRTKWLVPIDALLEWLGAPAEVRR